MPKMKTNSGASKRFTRTASGKVKFKHAYKNHILTKKSKKRKRAMRNAGYVPATDEQRMVLLLGGKV